jgi:hypothetical protein
VTYIPLAFQPWEAPAMQCPETTGFEDLKAIAVGRLMLDNFPHIKSYWIMIGPRLAQVGLSFGADDIDGTVTEEKIAHDAGRAHGPVHDRARAGAPGPGSRPPPGGARHRCSTSSRNGERAKPPRVAARFGPRARRQGIGLQVTLEPTGSGTS